MSYPKAPGDPEAHRALAARHLEVVQERDRALKLVAVLLREVSIHREPVTDVNCHDRWRRRNIAMAETDGARLKLEALDG